MQQLQNLHQPLVIRKRKLLIFITILLVVLVIFGWKFITLNNPCFGESLTALKKENCYLIHAIENNDASYCKGFEKKYEDGTGDNLRGACFTELAVINSDPVYCESLTYYGENIGIVGECYTALAITKNDQSICDRAFNSDICYSWLSAIRKDLKICSFIRNQNIQDICYQAHQENNLKDKSFFCDQMVTLKAKDACNQMNIIETTKP